MLSFALHTAPLHGHYLRVYLHFVDNDDLEDDEVEDDPDDVADPLYHTEVCTPCAHSCFTLSHNVVHSHYGCTLQLKAIVGQYARVVYEGVGSDAFGEECSLLDDKGASWLQLRIATELSKQLLTSSPATLSGLAERVFLQNVLVATAGTAN